MNLKEVRYRIAKTIQKLNEEPYCPGGCPDGCTCVHHGKIGRCDCGGRAYGDFGIEGVYDGDELNEKEIWPPTKGGIPQVEKGLITCMVACLGSEWNPITGSMGSLKKCYKQCRATRSESYINEKLKSCLRTGDCPAGHWCSGGVCRTFPEDDEDERGIWPPPVGPVGPDGGPFGGDTPPIGPEGRRGRPQGTCSHTRAFHSGTPDACSPANLSANTAWNATSCSSDADCQTGRLDQGNGGCFCDFGTSFSTLPEIKRARNTIFESIVKLREEQMGPYKPFDIDDEIGGNGDEKGLLGCMIACMVHMGSMRKCYNHCRAGKSEQINEQTGPYNPFEQPGHRQGPNWAQAQGNWANFNMSGQGAPPPPPQFLDNMSMLGCLGKQRRHSNLNDKLLTKFPATAQGGAVTPNNPMWQSQLYAKIVWLQNDIMTNCQGCDINTGQGCDPTPNPGSFQGTTGTGNPSWT